MGMTFFTKKWKTVYLQGFWPKSVYLKCFGNQLKTVYVSPRSVLLKAVYLDALLYYMSIKWEYSSKEIFTPLCIFSPIPCFGLESVFPIFFRSLTFSSHEKNWKKKLSDFTKLQFLNNNIYIYTKKLLKVWYEKNWKKNEKKKSENIFWLQYQYQKWTMVLVSHTQT